MCRTDREGMSRKLRHSSKRKLPSRSADDGVESVVEVTVQRDDLLLQLKNYKVSTKHLVRKLSEEDVILKVMTSSMKQLIMKLCLLQNEKILLEKSNEQLINKYGEQKAVVGRRVCKLVKIHCCIFCSTGNVCR